MLHAFHEASLRPIDVDGPDGPELYAEVRATAERVAEHLRAECHSNPPDALRGGLAQLVAFLEATWGCDAVGFHPPELLTPPQRVAEVSGG